MILLNHACRQHINNDYLLTCCEAAAAGGGEDASVVDGEQTRCTVCVCWSGSYCNNVTTPLTSSHQLILVLKLRRVELLIKHHLTATGCHL